MSISVIPFWGHISSPSMNVLTGFVSVELMELVFSILKRIADQDGGKYEAAVYATQCSNLKRILPTCMDWEV